MADHVMSAGFVPVDAVFSDDGAGLLQMTAGERLREARAKAGLTLDEAAHRTRIRRDYLDAIESMDSRGLPARAYAIGYLRTYASFLSLEPDALVEQFKRDVDTETGRAQPTAAAKTRDPIKLPRGAFGAVLILASLASVAWWYSSQGTGSDGLLAVPPPPDAAPEWAREDFAERPARSSVEEIWAGLPLSEAVASSSTLVMRALEPVWMEVRDGSGRILFARQLEIGETYRALETGLTVSTANAGAIVLERDGEAIGPLGEAGMAVENLPVTEGDETADAPQ